MALIKICGIGVQTLDKFVQPFFNAADNTVVAGGTIATDRVIVY